MNNINYFEDAITTPILFLFHCQASLAAKRKKIWSTDEGAIQAQKFHFTPNFNIYPILKFPKVLKSAIFFHPLAANNKKQHLCNKKKHQIVLI